MKFPGVEEINLVDLLAESVKPKAVQENESVINSDDFEKEEVIKEEEIKVEKEVIEVDKPLEPEIPVNYSDEAMNVIAFIDGLQSLTMPFAYQRSIFSKADRKILKNWKEKGKPQEFTESEKELLIKVTYYKDLANDIEFSETEIDMLHKPLADVMAKYKIKMGPELALLGAAGLIFSHRLMPLFNRFEKMI